MKRFLVFIYSSYYPSGGMFDFEDSFDNIDSAIQYGRDNLKEVYDNNCQVYDSQNKVLLEITKTETKDISFGLKTQ